MTIKPWREVAKPHKDVLEGTFRQSEFAADISQVAQGVATEDYQDAEKFFSRTYITEGMRLLLISVAKRLAGMGGDPVIQLQTAFGGGKTHTMLTVYHMATRSVSTDRLDGVPPILDEAGIADLPKARVAVIDGIKLSPNQPQDHGSIQAHTLWGELAYQLLGQDGFSMVAESDATGTSPGKEVLKKLLEKAAPCVILMDEVLAFMRQLDGGQTHKAGNFDSNISFIQALTEAMKLVPTAILLASLPESELEVGGAMGQKTLNSLEKYFARVESVWKPVATTESFEIVRRRLFATAGDRHEVEGICREFSEYYRAHADKLPTETSGHEYYERLVASYPIHPEIFDRLYEDWSTLDKFQRTRGVLQYMAIIIHRLWNSDNRDALILPGSIPLEDSNVRNKSIHYLPQGWEPVIEKEVDGPRSEPFAIDGRDTRFGGVQAARRAMRSIFLGSAPAASSQVVRGIEVNRILLGCSQPGQTIGVFDDVLKRLRDRLQYLYSDQGRFWLDTKPNLRREMEGRKNQLSGREKVIPAIKKKLEALFKQNACFAGIHIFTPCIDIPDDIASGPRLVILSPDALHGCSRNDNTQAANACEKILNKRGDLPRQKRNRLLFLAPEADCISRLKDSARTRLAWQEILDDIDNGKLNLDLFQVKQAKSQAKNAGEHLKQIVKETYKWLLCPEEDLSGGKPNLEWQATAISTVSSNIVAEIETNLKEEEWLITKWGPIHLKSLLQKWYFKDGKTNVSAKKVWQDCCNYLYMPRLMNETVFTNTVAEGMASEDFFGFAAGEDNGQFLGFRFGEPGMVSLDDSAVLIAKDAALAYKESLKPAPCPEPGPGLGPEPGPGPEPKTGPIPDPGPGPKPAPIKTQFYSNIDLNPISAKADFADIMDEVVQQFTARTGMDVTISVEIQAKSSEGFDENLQRSVKENCNVLKFSSAEFEEE